MVSRLDAARRIAASAPPMSRRRGALHKRRAERTQVAVQQSRRAGVQARGILKSVAPHAAACKNRRGPDEHAAAALLHRRWIARFRCHVVARTLAALLAGRETCCLPGGYAPARRHADRRTLAATATGQPRCEAAARLGRHLGPERPPEQDRPPRVGGNRLAGQQACQHPPTIKAR